MAKTTNLGLNLNEDENTLFSTWRKSIDGNNGDTEKSNMQIIDEAIGEIKTPFSLSSSSSYAECAEAVGVAANGRQVVYTHSISGCDITAILTSMSSNGEVIHASGFGKNYDGQIYCLGFILDFASATVEHFCISIADQLDTGLKVASITKSSTYETCLQGITDWRAGTHVLVYGIFDDDDGRYKFVVLPCEETDASDGENLSMYGLYENANGEIAKVGFTISFAEQTVEHFNETVSGGSTNVSGSSIKTVEIKSVANLDNFFENIAPNAHVLSFNIQGVDVNCLQCTNGLNYEGDHLLMGRGILGFDSDATDGLSFPEIYDVIIGKSEIYPNYQFMFRNTDMSVSEGQDLSDDILSTNPITIKYM